MSWPDDEWTRSALVLLVVAAVLVGALALWGCAKDPGPRPGDAWRRCEEACGGHVFALDFGTDPPTCHCMEDW